MKFELDDGSSKEYNLSDIDSISFVNKTEKSQMVIHYSGSKYTYYPPYLIDKITILEDSIKNMQLSVLKNLGNYTIGMLLMILMD